MKIREKGQELLFAMCAATLSSPVFAADIIAPGNTDAQMGGLSKGVLLEQRSAQVGIDLKDTKDELPSRMLTADAVAGTGEAIKSRQKLVFGFNYGVTPRLGLGLSTSIIKESHHGDMHEPSQNAVRGASTLRFDFGLISSERVSLALSPYVSDGAGERADDYYSLARKETYGAFFNGQVTLGDATLPFSLGFRNREKRQLGEIYIGEEIMVSLGLNYRITESFSAMSDLKVRNTRILDADTPISSDNRDYRGDAMGVIGLAMHTDSASLALNAGKPLEDQIGFNAARSFYSLTYAVKFGDKKGTMVKHAEGKAANKDKKSGNAGKAPREVSEFEQVRQKLLEEARASEKQLGIQEEVEAELAKIRAAEAKVAAEEARQARVTARKKIQDEITAEENEKKQAASARAQIDNDLGEEYLIETSDLEWDGIDQ